MLQEHNMLRAIKKFVSVGIVGMLTVLASAASAQVLYQDPASQQVEEGGTQGGQIRYFVDHGTSSGTDPAAHLLLIREGRVAPNRGMRILYFRDQGISAPTDPAAHLLLIKEESASLADDSSQGTHILYFIDQGSSAGTDPAAHLLLIKTAAPK